jgi:uncharacterized protein (TIGR03067 family)
VPAIYELDGNMLKICFPQADPADPPGVNIFIGRPKVMSGTGPLRYVIQFERVEEPQTDVRLLGNWQVISVKGATEKTNWPLDAKAEAITFAKPRQFAGEAQPTSNVIIETKDGRVMVLDYGLLTSSQPQGIDLIPRALWGGKGKEVFPGIYQIDGDTLNICLGLANQERPKDFAVGDKRVLVVLKRLPDVQDRQKFAGTWRLVSLPNGKKASGKEVEEAIRVKMKWLADEEGRKLKWIPLLEPRMQVLVTYDAEGKWKQQTHGDTSFTFMNCEGTSAIDAAKKPRTIDCVVTHSGNLHAVQNEGEKKGQIKRGIYEFIDDDTYRICFAAPGKERPANFAAKADSGQIVWVMQRVKKATK